MQDFTTSIDFYNEILWPTDIIIGFILSEVLLKAAPQALPDFPLSSIKSPPVFNSFSHKYLTPF